MTVIRVETAANGYDVAIGPIEAGLERFRDIARGSKPVLISDSRVFALHGAAVAESLGAEVVLVPEGETAKNWDRLHELLSQLAKLNISRNTPLVALGGGSIGDLAGLAASLFKRGCPIVHVPTTLLAQVDSAVGGKTAIDAFGEKNLIGTFHQPALVIIDPAFLDTLDERQLRAGYAEVVKYGLIDDPAFFSWCEANGRGLLAGHPDLRLHAISASIAAKSRLVTGDVEDRLGKRALLNLGHSFGHAIESEAGLGKVLHGEAVALGIVLAHLFSAEIGLCPQSDVDRIRAHFQACGLPTQLADVGLGGRGGQLVNWMTKDKKNQSGKVALILSRGIGHAFLESHADTRRLADFLDRAA